MRIRRMGLIVGVAAFTLWGPAARLVGGEGSGTTILDCRNSFWRFRTVRETEEVVLDSGKVDHVRFKYPGEWFTKYPDKIEVDTYTVEQVDVVRLPGETPLDWMKPDFDDSTWVRCHGPMLDKSQDLEWKLVLARGRFEVTDPGKAGDLRLSVTFRGGCVVYLNGEELTRAFMPAGSAGEITPETPAEPYPREVYLDDAGYAVWPHDDKAVYLDRSRKRVREISGFKIPPARLKKGANLLAVAIHRAPTDRVAFLRRLRTRPRVDGGAFWCKVGLIDIALLASPGSSAVPNVARQENKGFIAWNQSIIQVVHLSDYPDPFAPLGPIRLTGVRNGTFAGQVVVGDDKPIRNLKAEVSDLKGPGTIPASAAQVRYAMPDGAADPQQSKFFDSLEESPPAQVPVSSEGGGAVEPIWMTLTVPADATPGDYAGTITISAEGVAPVRVPVKVRVIDWALPPVSEYAGTLDIIESPESLAMAYDVPLWSEEHFKLLDKTFSLLATLGAKTLYITCIRRTHFGNEHAMVRWIRSEEGEFTPDFSVVEKYLDVAAKHLGTIPGVMLYCWEPIESQGHAGVRIWDKPILITVVDPRTGDLSARQGPAWGTPEARDFWKKLTDGIGAVLKKRGLEGSMLFGLIGDSRPTKIAMDDICAGVPDARWAIHSHYYCGEWQGHKMGMVSALWGIGCQPADPSQGYSFGWSNPLWLLYFPREMHLRSTLVEHRTKLENWMGARRSYTPFIAKGMGPRGLGRLGADFWVVLKDRHGRPRYSLAGRYPEAAWGQLHLNNGIPYLLGKGKKGPLATIRSEAFREGLQEVEARVYLEKALLDDEAKPLLGQDLIGRCRTALDERIRMCLNAPGDGDSWFISSDWCKRNELLFSLAAEVSRKLGREPNPNLKPEPDKRR